MERLVRRLQAIRASIRYDMETTAPVRIRTIHLPGRRSHRSRRRLEVRRKDPSDDPLDTPLLRLLLWWMRVGLYPGTALYEIVSSRL